RPSPATMGRGRRPAGHPTRSRRIPMSATMTAPEAKPELNLARLHDDFPDTRILGCAKRLNVIVDAWRAGVGGLEGVPYLVVDAINATEDLRSYLVEWGQVRGVLSQDPSQDP